MQSILLNATFSLQNLIDLINHLDLLVDIFSNGHKHIDQGIFCSNYLGNQKSLAVREQWWAH
jgi:hypothetical protein